MRNTLSRVSPLTRRRFLYYSALAASATALKGSVAAGPVGRVFHSQSMALCE